MKHLPLNSISQIDNFLKSNSDLEMEIISVKEKYEFIKIVLTKIKYRKLSKKREKSRLRKGYQMPMELYQG